METNGTFHETYKMSDLRPFAASGKSNLPNGGFLKLQAPRAAKSRYFVHGFEWQVLIVSRVSVPIKNGQTWPWDLIGQTAARLFGVLSV